MRHPEDGPARTPDDRTPDDRTTGATHPDEGTIHAWLDDALPAAEAAALAAHLEGCAGCRAAVAEARGLVAASTRIVRALDDGPGGVRSRPASPMPVGPATPDPAVRAIDGARSGGRGGPPRRWRVPAIAAVGLLAVGTTVVLQRSGPLSPLTAPRTAASSEGAGAASAPPAERQSVEVAPGGPGPSGAAGVSSTPVPSPAGRAAAPVTDAPRAAPERPDAPERKPSAPPVAEPPRPPLAADVAAARSAARPDSATAPAAPAVAAPSRMAGGVARRSTERLFTGPETTGVAGAPAPGVAAPSGAVARSVGPVLTGRVVTPEGSPIANARITLPGMDQAAVSDGQGRFRLAGVPTGNHTAFIRRTGFQPVSLPLRVAAVGDSVLTVALVATPSSPVGDVAASADVASAGAAATGLRRPAADSARRGMAARATAPAILTPPAPPSVPAPATAPAPSPQSARSSTSAAAAAAAAESARRLVGCYRLEVGGAPTAGRDSAEAALPGWLRLLATAAAGRPGWLAVEPLLAARHATVGSAGWRVGEHDEVEIVWPAAAAGREVVLRLRGSAEVLTGTAALRPADGRSGAAKGAAETEAASVVAVRGVCAR